jgi:glucose/arabinose dehydrogenase
MVKHVLSALCVLVVTTAAFAATEDDYYRVVTLPPGANVLEISGIEILDDGRPIVCTRRGEVFIVENAYSEPPEPVFKRYAFGLSEPLGLQRLNGWIYFAQRGELSRMKDTDGDEIADVFETVCDDWQISGNYHEFAFGPKLDKEGYLWVTLNKPFGGEPYGRADWRGWAVKVDPKTGKMYPMCCGLRSPAGVEVSPWGDVFYTDNQGEWCNASKLSQLEYGDFHGHPHGLPTTQLPECPIKKPAPGDVPDGQYMKDLKKIIPNFKMPAVWFPYGKMGKSPSGMAWDTTGGKFGPFTGQVFVGDQNQSRVMRVFLEKIDGHWQGACFPFRPGLQCGVIRIEWGKDGSLFVGQSNRGWGSSGGKPYGMQRIIWTGKVPFEVHEMHATPDGFELTFTEPIDKASAVNPASYNMTSYTYRLRSAYGGPDEDVKTVQIVKAMAGADGKSVRLTLDPVRAGYVHELHLPGVKSADGEALLHKEAYYTLVNVPK